MVKMAKQRLRTKTPNNVMTGDRIVMQQKSRKHTMKSAQKCNTCQFYLGRSEVQVYKKKLVGVGLEIIYNLILISVFSGQVHHVIKYINLLISPDHRALSYGASHQECFIIILSSEKYLSAVSRYILLDRIWWLVYKWPKWENTCKRCWKSAENICKNIQKAT